jgi:excisionase family DNA binding protein
MEKRGLNYKEAADYVGISEDLLREAVAAGRIHQPVRFGRRRVVFDRQRLDDDLNRLYGLEAGTTKAAPSTVLMERLRDRKTALRRGA